MAEIGYIFEEFFKMEKLILPFFSLKLRYLSKLNQIGVTMWQLY